MASVKTATKKESSSSTDMDIDFINESPNAKDQATAK